MNQPLCFFLANNPDTVDKLEGLVALWSKVIEQVLAESEQVGHTPLWLMYSTLLTCEFPTNLLWGRL